MSLIFDICLFGLGMIFGYYIGYLRFGGKMGRI